MKFVSFGEIIWDIYGKERKIGGAPLNISAHASLYGFDSYLISAVGNDALGEEAFRKLKDLKVNTLPYKVIYKHQINNGSVIKSILNKFDFPLIVKPSTLGSSIGINKVENANQLPNALFEASLYDNKILLEPFIEHKQELNIAIIGYQDDLEVSEVESVNDNSFIISFRIIILIIKR